MYLKDNSFYLGTINLRYSVPLDKKAKVCLCPFFLSRSFCISTACNYSLILILQNRIWIDENLFITHLLDQLKLIQEISKLLQRIMKK